MKVKKRRPKEEGVRKNAKGKTMSGGLALKGGVSSGKKGVIVTQTKRKL